MATLTTSYQLLAQKELGKVYNSNKAYIRLYAKYNSQSISNNSTSISIQARLYNESTWYASSGTYYRITGSGSIDSGNISKLTSASSMWAKGEVTLGTQTKDISHNADGTRSIHAEVQFVSSPWGWNVTASVSGVGLPSIPRQANISTAPDFNDEGNPTITYANPAGNSVSSLDACISLTGSKDDVPYRSINKTGTLSYTFNLTEAERNTLRKATTTNSRSVIFYVRTGIGGNTYYSTLTRTFKIVNGNPVFDDFVFEDVNQETLELTGNNQNIIAGYSDVKVTIPVANKAVAQKQATMSKYRFNSIDANYSDSNDVSITSNKVTNGDFTVYAIDSRGNSKPVTKNATNVINYTPLQKGNITSNRQNGVSENTILKFDGKFWNDYFGSNLRNIEVGDDLSGKTIYCQFPETLGEELVLDDYVRVNSIQFVSCYDASIGELTGYLKSGMETRESGLDYQYVKVEDEDIFNNDPTKEQIINYSSYQLSDTFGVVTEIDTTSSAYKYIFIEDDSRKNSIISSKYRFKIAGASDDDWSDEFDLILNTDDKGNFNFEELIKGDTETLGFNISNAYNIEVIIEDKLSKITYTTNLGSGTPHIAYAKNGIGIMGKYDESVGGLLQVAGKKISDKIGQTIRVYNTVEQVLQPNSTIKLNFNAIKFNTSDSLVLQNNKIIIGKGVNCILVNGRWTKWGTYSKYIYVYKNGVGHSFDISTAGTIETSIVLPVEEGDYIELFCYHENSSNVSVSNNQDHTFLQVTVLN